MMSTKNAERARRSMTKDVTDSVIERKTCRRDVEFSHAYQYGIKWHVLLNRNKSQMAYIKRTDGTHVG